MSGPAKIYPISFPDISIASEPSSAEVSTAADSAAFVASADSPVEGFGVVAVQPTNKIEKHRTAATNKIIFLLIKNSSCYFLTHGEYAMTFFLIL
ncbi:hypothetical protein SDC9_113483 [bioreactor metagenome]|uniref:Uncharacterized protein n=1 Tax=bioreactor metagenome TaxID=1076179 RepID=A0A645BTK8_9ZZZZ